MDIYKRLKELNIELVPVVPAVGVFVNYVPFGENLMYFSGAGPTQHEGKFDYVGRVGETVDEKTAYDAARSVGITLLSAMDAALGDLNRVTKIVKATGFVNSATDFCSQPKVINGFSELMVQVFGQAVGMHSRSAIGVASLPANIPVEIEVLIQYE